MKAGLQFESSSSAASSSTPSAARRLPEFRYAYHEVIEEAQHSLMFQEFVNRTGLDARRPHLGLKLGARASSAWPAGSPSCSSSSCSAARTRSTTCSAALRSGRELHPLLERIMRIHVTEEARHLSFARHYLRTNVP